MFASHQKSLFVASLICLLPVINAVAAKITWISSSNGQFWKTMPAPVLRQSQPGDAPDVRIAVERMFQTIDGFGGCFNELGWAALQKTSSIERKRV